MLKDKQDKLKAGLSKRMRTQAQTRKCPQCGRKMSLSKWRDEFGTVIYCRYCSYEKAILK